MHQHLPFSRRNFVPSCANLFCMPVLGMSSFAKSSPPPLQALNSLLTSPSGWTGTRFVSVHCDAKDCVVAVEMGEKLLYERRVYGTLTWFWTLNNLRQANVSALWLLDSCATGACVERCQRVH